MNRILYSIMLLLLALFAGCTHIVVGTNARDYGETIHTRYKYRLVCDQKYQYTEISRANYVPKYQPYVFDDDGIPIKVEFRDMKDVTSGEWSMVFPLFSYFILPGITTKHFHQRCILSVVGNNIGFVDLCAFERDAWALPILSPLVLALASCGDSPCYSGGGVFTASSGSIGYEHYDGIHVKSMAYGIASRLKAAEDSGMINEPFAARTRSAQSLSDAAAARAKIQNDNMARRGILINVSSESLFEIVRCDNEKGKDFAYTFTLRKRGGGAATLADYGVMRSGFRSAIRTHYISSHPDSNPRTIVIDFTEYALKGGAVRGRVAVLTVVPESLTYNAANRRGVIKVRIGEGQLEDARRWIRRNLASLVHMKNLFATGDLVPKEGRFFSEDEAMHDGVLEVSFKTE